MIIDKENYLAHYGILRRSGRYPWGSGGNVVSRSRTFLDIVKELQRKGMSEAQIAKSFSTEDHPFTTTDLRALKSIARNATKQADIAQAERLKAKGYSNVKIGEIMGRPESSIRALLAPGVKDRADILEATSNMLKQQVEQKGYIDVGLGVERHLGISKEKLGTAVARLKEEGYTVHYIKVPQLATGEMTTVKVLAKPGTTYSEAYRNRDRIKLPFGYSDDGGRSYTVTQPPLSISSKRVQVRYKEEGGDMEDGVIYVRSGVKDLSLGGSRYAQVRIAVDGTHYMKGMAIIRDDMPPGVDIIYNTNKSSTGNKLDAMKPLKFDEDGNMSDLPFGALVRQKTDPKTGKVTSAMNIVGTKEGAGEPGAWESWSRSLSSQFLSKQSPSLAKTQLDMTYDRKKREFDEIMSLTNPAVRKRLLESFADDADSAAVHLKAAALPRQGNHVILPVRSLKDNEVYAPNYRNGEKVVLIRHPHGGKFEIPELIVNNRNPEAKRLLGQAPDAIGINHKVAQRLSGADFDGDTVLVIPNNQGRVRTQPALEKLKNFDPIAAFPAYEGMPKMSARTKGVQMGLVSNLITDMTIRGASADELARAVRHSMVVIDAEKHNLNWKQSAIDNGIPQLMEKYQGKSTGGASTLISRASSEKRVPERKQGFRVDPNTGDKIFTETGATYTVTTKSGKKKVVLKTTRSTKLAEEKDARKLSSGTKIEEIYADHSNRLKALARQARKEAVNTKPTTRSPSAKKTYAKEVASLKAKLDVALKNAPLERNAQVVGNAIVSQKRRANPDIDPAELKKIRNKALNDARARLGAKKTRIEITDSEWDAIQSGAVTGTMLSQILNNTDLDALKQRATPRAQLLMTDAKTARARQMAALGYTQAEIADHLGVSLTTLKESLNS